MHPEDQYKYDDISGPHDGEYNAETSANVCQTKRRSVTYDSHLQHHLHRLEISNFIIDICK